jgi:hypothetical protein
MHGWTENVYSIFRDKLLLLGEHVFAVEDFFSYERLSARKQEELVPTSYLRRKKILRFVTQALLSKFKELIVTSP